MKLFLKNKQPLADNFDFIKSGLFAYRRNCSEEILSLPSSVFKLISVSWLVLKDTDCGILPPRRVEMWYFLGKSWLLGGYRLWEDKPTTKEAGGKLNTHKPGSIINCHLCACDQSRCSGLEAVCVCVCVRVFASIGRWCLVWAEPVQTWTPAAYCSTFPFIIPLLPRSSRDLLRRQSLHKYLALFMFCTAAHTRKRRACVTPVLTWTAVFIA